MVLYLVRHGIAVDRMDPACPPDPERSLTAKGKKRTRAVARGLKALDLKADLMLSSPYMRAIQTAQIMADVLGFDSDRIRLTESLLPDKNPVALCEELRQLDGSQVMCFGHAPNLDEVVAYLLGAPDSACSLKKAGVAGLTFREPEAGSASLVSFFPPRALRLVAGDGRR